VRVQIRRTRRQLHGFHPNIGEHVQELGCEQRVTIMDQVALALQEPVAGIRDVATHLAHPAGIGLRRDSGDLDPGPVPPCSQLLGGDVPVTLLEQAQVKFPSETSIGFELGTVFDKQKRFADAEAAFRQVLAREPDNAPALNYLGYMLADRGERLDESVTYLKKALEIDPDNGSYLDSLGWAYYKGNKLDLASDNLKRAAEQLKTNSVIQDHYGELLFKMGRYDDAIAAWTRALAGDGDSIDRAGIDRKIRSAHQKLGKK